MPHLQDGALSSAILETVRLPLLALDADLRVETANDAFLTQFQVRREETIGRLVYDLGNGQWDIPELRRLLGEILPERSVVSDYRVAHDFERIGRRIMHVGARRIDRAGAPDLILLAISDDTERDTLRAEVAARMELADKLIDSVREGLLILDPDLRVRSASGSFYEIFGVDRAGTEGRLVYELGNGQWDIPELRTLLEDILPRERCFDDYEVTHRFEDIGQRVMMLNGRRLDHMDLILLAIRDITEARQTQVRLEEVATAAHIGVFEGDLSTGTLYWSPEMREIVGYSQDDPPPPPGVMPDFIHPDDRESVRALLARVTDPLSDGAIYHEHRILRPDGETRWVQMHGSAEFRTRDDERCPVRVHGILLDVTGRKVAEEALRESEERQAFLLKVSDAMRALSDPCEIIGTACRLLGEKLAVDRAYYVEIDEATGMSRVERDFVRGVSPSLAGTHRIEDFAWSVDIMRRGDCHVVADTQASELVPEADRAACAALQIVGCMGAPLIKDGDLVGALCVTAPEPREWTGAEVELLQEVGARVWSTIERARAEAARRESETRYRQLFDSIDQGFCVIEVLFDESGAPVDFLFLDVNGAFEQQTGLNDAVGRTMRSFAPDHEEYWFEFFGRVAVSQKPERFESPAVALDRFYEVSAFPFGEPGKRRVGVLFNDISERKDAEAHRELLLREVNHRAKNMLSVVLSVANISARESGPNFLETFRRRVMALSANQDLLVSGGWRGVSLHELVRAQLAHFGTRLGSRIAISGPSLVLASKPAECLGMALHELATNASKYGALSGAEGHVDIDWRVTGDRRFRMRWRERGGPAVAPPTRQGFGSSVIKEIVEAGLTAEVTLDYAPDGLVWQVDAPADECLEAREDTGEAAGASSPRQEAAGDDRAGRGRILVVDDEAMIAMALSSSLREAGHEVVGPAGSVDRALALLETEGCDAAVLDVNLGRETSAPIADALTARRIPFVTVTGYSRDQVPEALRAAPLLSKPVNTDHLITELSGYLGAGRGAGN